MPLSLCICWILNFSISCGISPHWNETFSSPSFTQGRSQMSASIHREVIGSPRSVHHVFGSINDTDISGHVLQISSNQGSNSFHIGSLLWILIPGLGQNGSNYHRPTFWDEQPFVSGTDAYKIFLGIVSIKGPIQCKHFPKQDGKGKDIGFSSIGFSQGYLGCHVGNTTSCASQVVPIAAFFDFLVWLQAFAQSKIKEFDISPNIKTNILGFDISIN
jgi:hypothetical protein